MKKPLRTTLLALSVLVFASGPWNLAAAQGVRPEIGKPLQQAAELLRAGKARAALARVAAADAVRGKTADEQLVIDRMRAAAAQRAGDTKEAVAALESVYARSGAAEKGRIAEQVSAMYAQQRNNGKAAEWLSRAIEAGNRGAGVQQLQGYLQAASGDYAGIAREAGAAVAAAEQAGRAPAQADLLRLADAQQRLGRNDAVVVTLEKLVSGYPKAEYWDALLDRLPRKRGFASSRYALDVLRLRRATGTLTEADEYVQMAQMALQSNLTHEARDVLDEGYAKGVLGKGDDAPRQERLRALAAKEDGDVASLLALQLTAARRSDTGDALVRVGSAYAGHGEIDRGIALIEQGIARGKLHHPNDARLRLGLAQLQSAGTHDGGVKSLGAVKGNAGAADIARLTLLAGRG
ncbi:MAG: hypothetical protein KGN16_25080 [Burkholderiales bacterium]|nr:hypothetical protein [Burkholderiales bacterium]